MNLSTFTENTSNPNLTRAVVKQFGRWTDFKDSASDIAFYGADGGVPNFTSTFDTVAFYEANRGNIHALARLIMDEHGELRALSEFIVSFTDDLEAYEVEDALIEGESSEDYITVANSLSWFALEQTAHHYDIQAGA